MKQLLYDLLKQALEALRQDGTLCTDPDIQAWVIRRNRDPKYGDFATNLAMILAKRTGLRPHELAARLIAALPASTCLAKVAVAGPGFINFFLDPTAYHDEIRRIMTEGSTYGQSRRGGGKSVGVEFVSANPTGPLHVGHGRNGVLGDCVARMLEAYGWQVTREFYYNDAGTQIANLTRSVQARVLGLSPDDPGWPENSYCGDYIADVAHAYLAGESIQIEGRTITAAKDPEDLEAIRHFAVAWLRHAQNLDLAAFGIHFDHYFLESSLYNTGEVENTVRTLQAQGHTYEKGGALWLRSTELGDDKDRVMRKSDGSYTYFVPDVAYHLSKWRRGYQRAITVLGADHHGSLERVKAGLQALHANIPEDYPDYLLYQMVTVQRSGHEVKISKRAGSYVTLRELIDEVGRDATRYFLISRRHDSPLVFDIDLARAQSSDNPIYYIQYAHARICSVFRHASNKAIALDQTNGLAHLEQLKNEHEQTLFRMLTTYPEQLEAAAMALEPHVIALWLRELAHAFHACYNTHLFLVEDKNLRDARLALLAATRQILRNGLDLLGLSAPESM